MDSFNISTAIEIYILTRSPFLFQWDVHRRRRAEDIAALDSIKINMTKGHEGLLPFLWSLVVDKHWWIWMNRAYRDRHQGGIQEKLYNMVQSESGELWEWTPIRSERGKLDLLLGNRWYCWELSLQGPVGTVEADTSMNLIVKKAAREVSEVQGERERKGETDCLAYV